MICIIFLCAAKLGEPSELLVAFYTEGQEPLTGCLKSPSILIKHICDSKTAVYEGFFLG